MASALFRAARIRAKVQESMSDTRNAWLQIIVINDLGAISSAPQIGASKVTRIYIYNRPVTDYTVWPQVDRRVFIKANDSKCI